MTAMIFRAPPHWEQCAIDVEDALEQPRPTLMPADRSMFSSAGSVGFSTAQHDRSTQRGVRCEHAVETDQVQARAGYQRGQRCMIFWGEMTMWVMPSR